MLSHQGVALFEKSKRIRRYGLVGGSVSLGVGVEVSKAHAKLRISASGSEWSSQLLLQCMPARCHALCCDDNGLNL